MDEHLILNLVDSFKSISLDVEVISCNTVENGNHHEKNNGNLITVFSVGDGTDNLQMHFYEAENTLKYQLKESESSSPLSLEMHYVLEEANSTEVDYSISDRVLFLWEGYKTLKVESQHSPSDANSATVTHAEKAQSSNDNNKERCSKVKKKKTAVQSPPGKKMCKMKTALDVINRVKWDNTVDPDVIIVGYKDRFIGTIETPFKTLDWESDISSVGQCDRLVIPQHRIEYFKYQGVVVWDKKRRLDHVFGSTGDEITIRDVISQIESGETPEGEGDVAPPAVSGNASPAPEKKDDDRPTHFICIKLNAQHLQKSVGQFYQTLLRTNLPRLEDEDEVRDLKIALMSPPQLLHVTLCVFRAASNDAMKLVQQILSKVVDDFKAFNVSVDGVNRFDNSCVLFGVPLGKQLVSLQRALYTNLKRACINLKANKEPYKPHMTLAKFNKFDPSQRSVFRKLRYNKRHTFGRQFIEEVFICSLNAGDPPEQDGFYHIVSSVRLGINVNDMQQNNDLELAHALSSAKLDDDLDDDDDKIEENWMEHDWTLTEKHQVTNLTDLRNEQNQWTRNTWDNKTITPRKSQTRKRQEPSEATKSQSWNVAEFYNESMVKDPWDDDPGTVIQQQLGKTAESTKDDVSKQSDDSPFFDPEPKPRRVNKKDRRRNRDRNENEDMKTSTNKRSPKQRGDKSDVRLSKTLTAILRHNKMGFTVGSDGYLRVDDILQHPHFVQTLKVTKDDIIRVVNDNDKQRFTLSTNQDGDDIIRANQGHSVVVNDLHMEEIQDATLYPTVVHGTYRTALPAIKRDGLHRMNRNHIHMTTARPSDSTQVISGMRKTCNVFIYINIKAAIEDGIRFYLSSNEVILCGGDSNGYLPPKYFERIDLA